MLNTENDIGLYDDVSNPLDAIEEIMMNNDWVYDRMSQDEMTVHITGKHGTYKLAFIWQDTYHALQFSCAPDVTIGTDKLKEASVIINKINSSLWLGHFDIRPVEEQYNNPGNNIPCFRHTSLFRGMTDNSGLSQMEDLIDIALHECERFYPSFKLLAEASHLTKSDMSLALMDVAGMS